MIFMLGYEISDINPGAYIIISNSYQILTLMISYSDFNRTNINPYYGVSGIILTLIGCGLLAVSNN